MSALASQSRRSGDVCGRAAHAPSEEAIFEQVRCVDTNGLHSEIYAAARFVD